MDEQMTITIYEFNSILKQLCDGRYLCTNGDIAEFRIYKRGDTLFNGMYSVERPKKEIILSFARDSIKSLSVENIIRILLIELERNNIKINDDSIFNC